MKHFSSVLLSALLAVCTASTRAGETYTLTVENAANQTGESAQSITLNQGDTAQLKFTFPSFRGTAVLPSLVATIGGKEFVIPTTRPKDTANTPELEINPIVLAGPAVIKLRIGGAGMAATSAFSTIEVN